MKYEFKTSPFSHQQKVFEESRDLDSFGLLWEQGTGKSKATIDNIGYLYAQGQIDGVLLVAPPGVERNWLTDELPTHMPDWILEKASLMHYRSMKASTKWHQRDLASNLCHDGLSVLAMSYDAFMTKRGKEAAWKFLQRRKVMHVLDEAHNIKTPGAKRTKSVVASGRYSTYRRILTGTPIANGPFDIYSQMRFLEQDFWKRRGFNSFTEFKQHFGVFEKQTIYVPGGDQRQIDVLLHYQNLGELRDIIQSATSRVTKEDVLDLPEKLYTRRYFELTPEQEKAYREMRDEYMVELAGEVVEAPLAIVRLLRMQQILCGYLPTGDEDKLTPLSGRNPRIEAVVDICEGLGDGKSIVWARFSHDIDLLMEALQKAGRRPVRYDGKISDEEAARSKEAFQNGDATDFVANPDKGREGITLIQAKTVIYYNNSFKLINRLQSEDRAHRIGQTEAVNYIDIVAPDTVDMHIVDALRGKFDIASQINGDRLRSWL